MSGTLPERCCYVAGMSWRIVSLLLFAAVVVAGCGPATSTPVAVTGLPKAADGTNVAACGDGNCVVEVHAPERIALTGEGDVTLLAIDRIGSDGVDFTVTSTDGGTSTGSIQHGCTLTFYSGGGGSSCGGGNGPPDRQTGVLAMQLVGQSGAKAVLRLVAGRAGEPPASLLPPGIPSLAPIEPPVLPTF